jgi:hypothetical protein
LITSVVCVFKTGAPLGSGRSKRMQKGTLKPVNYCS